VIKPITIECQISFHRRGYGGRKEIQQGDQSPSPAPVPNRVPRIARFMALAIRFERLIQSGTVTNYADLAQLAHVSRARITQIMNLLLLAPDIQEAILFLPPLTHGRDPIHIRQLQRIALRADWQKQRRIWDSIISTVSSK
jgi:tRNA nucleotidyltransferase/poly(A) polymerase